MNMETIGAIIIITGIIGLIWNSIHSDNQQISAQKLIKVLLKEIKERRTKIEYLEAQLKQYKTYIMEHGGTNKQLF